MQIIISIALCLHLLAAPPPGQKQKLRLVWSDEFKSNGKPDSANWTYDIGNGQDGWGNHELQHYTKSSDNIYVKDGRLFIEAKKKDGAWTSARLKSQGRRNFRYGKIVFRAKLPVGKGTWPALWLLGEDIASAGWPKCGEIDVMEHVGRNPAVVQSALHTPSSSGDTKNRGETKVPTFDSEFHDYEVSWTESKMDFSVDGKIYYTYQPTVKDKETWPFDSNFFLIMNIAIGGGLGGTVDPDLTSARMEVEYVRVYELVKSKK
jgi:beta-glucanase (GH16 family)